MPDSNINKPPRNEHELELRLVRLLGNDNRRMLVMRSLMASTIAAQFLPDGAVLKGGGALRLRFGSSFTRNTIDFDTTRRGDLDEFLKELRMSLGKGWNGFSGEAVILPQASPKGVPFEYVMQPVDLKLRYKNNPWCTVNLEISHNEVGAADDCDMVESPEEVLAAFKGLGFPTPRPVALITLEHQIAQKLHGASDPSDNNRRAHDLIDLQLMMNRGKVDLSKVGLICQRLFALRRKQEWPTVVKPHTGWETIYAAQKGDLPVLPSLNDAIAWTNELIEKICRAL